MGNPAWLEGLKAGDEVLWSGGYGDARVAKVQRVTATTVVVETTGTGVAFRKKDGRMRGQG